jgi:hypothetical protein
MVPRLDSSKGPGNFPVMSNATGATLAGILILTGGCLSLSGCKLILAPVKVAGAVVDTAYVGGKKAAKSTSDALDRRKERKQREEEEAAKADARGKSGSPQRTGAVQARPAAVDTLPVDQAPAIPVDDTIPLPVEPLALPQ